MISFVRHGETALNRDGRLQGRVDSERRVDSSKSLVLATRLSILGDQSRSIRARSRVPARPRRRSPRSPAARSRSTTA